ncbi:MAG TPA: argininosuccinate lyase [Acidimicrobiales bacterium]|nr:argininosuccinate lyase [Acidimicrobiales bacterium]
MVHAPGRGPGPRRRRARGRVTLWHGRMGDRPADDLMAFTSSLVFDVRLAADDVAGSRAHVRGLVRAGLVSEGEAGTLLVALDRVERELAEGLFQFAPSDEDVHTAVERRVTELAGEAGAKLHSGRSRNDQVATDLRLWTKRALADVARRAVGLQEVLLDRAREAEDLGTRLPGYTHLQRAQPVLLAHHLLAHGWALARDVDRLLDARRRLDVSPLGAGALAGSSLPLDPDATAAELGFAARFENSLDAVSDRDFVAESLFALSLLAVHLSRVGEEVVLWSSAEFGFLRLADAWSTGSSMLPQKKNPDVAELARAKAGRLIGHLAGLLATLKGLPLAYNRDLQEDKEPLFDAVDQMGWALVALAGLLSTATFDAERMGAAADTADSSAIDLAEWMVARGVPFRHAHASVAALVRDAVERHVPLDELVAAHPDLGPDALHLLEPGTAVSRRTTPGGAGPGPVAEQLVRFADRLAADRKRLPPT